MEPSLPSNMKFGFKQEFSYHKQIARQLRTSGVTPIGQGWTMPVASGV